MPSDKTQSYQFTDEMACLHVHDHTGLTSCDAGHCHIHPGITSPPIPHGNSHYHEIAGGTTYQNGHYHVYRAYTEPAIPLPNGFHTHYASFNTSFNFNHQHKIEGFVMATQGEMNTKPPVPYDAKSENK